MYHLTGTFFIRIGLTFYRRIIHWSKIKISRFRGTKHTLLKDFTSQLANAMTKKLQAPLLSCSRIMHLSNLKPSKARLMSQSNYSMTNMKRENSRDEFMGGISTSHISRILMIKYFSIYPKQSCVASLMVAFFQKKFISYSSNARDSYKISRNLKSWRA